MDITTSDELLEAISSVIEYMSVSGDEYYIAVEVAYQLRDEAVQAIINKDD